MIELEYFTPRGAAKATVHKSTGRLGFNIEAVGLIDFESNRYFRIGKNKADVNDSSLYLIVAAEGDEGVFKAGKAGDYYYLKTKEVLEDLDIDYDYETIIYNVEEMKDQDFKYYKLRRRDD